MWWLPMPTESWWYHASKWPRAPKPPKLAKPKKLVFVGDWPQANWGSMYMACEKSLQPRDCSTDSKEYTMDERENFDLEHISDVEILTPKFIKRLQLFKTILAISLVVRFDNS